MNRFLVLCAVLLTFSFPTVAKTVAGIPLPDTITTNDKTLLLNGAGVRSKFFIDLYVGSLFTSVKTNNALDVVEGAIPAAIRLNITSDMITSEKLADALNDGFDAATNGDIGAIERSIEAFTSATFKEAVSEGDQFTLVSIPGEGIYSYKNREQLALIEDEAFRQALMAVWLGDKPTDKDLKKEMLPN